MDCSIKIHFGPNWLRWNLQLILSDVSILIFHMLTEAFGYKLGSISRVRGNIFKQDFGFWFTTFYQKRLLQSINFSFSGLIWKCLIGKVFFYLLINRLRTNGCKIQRPYGMRSCYNSEGPLTKKKKKKKKTEKTFECLLNPIWCWKKIGRLDVPCYSPEQ